MTNITRLPLSSTSESLNSTRINQLNSPRPMLKLMKTSGKSSSNSNSSRQTKPSNSCSTEAIADDMTLNSNKQARLISLNYTPSNKSLSPLLNIKNNKNLIKQQISSKDNTEKFRYFYQIRRNNGDVLSKDFLNNLQQKQNNESQKSQSSDTNSKGNGNTSPQSTASSSSAVNVKINKNCSKKSTTSNSSCSTTTTITRVI